MQEKNQIRITTYLKHGLFGTSLTSLLVWVYFQYLSSRADYQPVETNISKPLFHLLLTFGLFCISMFPVWYGLSFILVLFSLLYGERRRKWKSYLELVLVFASNLVSIIPLSIIYFIFGVVAAFVLYFLF